MGADSLRYETGVLLGSGGVADVYRAVDTVLNRPVALKFLKREDPVLIERLLREARAQAKVEHELICKVYEVGELDGRAFIAMQYVDGVRLDHAAPQLTLEQKILVVRDVADAVHAAHRVGLIHRDLKPSNILLEPHDGSWRPFVTDFGLVRDAQEKDLTGTGEAIGTPSYMAPEQARGAIHLLDRRTDVYSLGAVLYELLVGRPPFVGDSPVEILVASLHTPVTPVRAIQRDVPRALELIAMKCLEKAPDRRYDSARALADDLKRYLDGEPIHARPPGTVERALALVRRHSVVAAGATIVVIAAIVVLAMWRSARQAAARQAAAAQHFGQQVERLEAGLHQAFLLPLHDTRRDREEVRRRMHEIEDETRDAGAAAELAGTAALGRGSLALHDYPEARRRLEDAVGHGYRPPEVTYALGQCLGALYQDARVDALRIKDVKARAAKLAEIEKTLRDPALGYLRTAAGVQQSASYGEGLIAFYEGRYADAIERARHAFEEAPWLYEAKQLEGDVLEERSFEAQNTGGYESALRDNELAGVAYAAAIEIARSDPTLHAAECSRWRRRLASEGWTSAQPGSPLEAYARATAVCERALTADPEAPAVYEELANVYGYRGEYQTYHGEDPMPALERDAEYAKRAVALAPERASAYSTLGLAQVRAALYQDGHGIDPVPNLRAAIATYGEAIKRRPAQASYNSLGAAWTLLAEYTDDADTALERGGESYQKAIDLTPTYAPAHSNLGDLFLRRAKLQLMRGQDPAKLVAAAIASQRRALEINPNFNFAEDELGSAYWISGRYAIMSGTDPEPDFHQALDHFAKAAAIDPNYAEPHRDAGSVYITRAELAVENNADPGVLLDTGRRELAIAFAKDDKDSETLRWQAEAERVAAAWAVHVHGTAAPALARATELLAKAEALNPRAADVFESRARLAIAGALDVSAGLTAIDRALAVAPQRSEPYALRGVLSATRPELADQARASFATAFQRNPLLSRRYATIAATVGARPRPAALPNGSAVGLTVAPRK